MSNVYPLKPFWCGSLKSALLQAGLVVSLPFCLSSVANAATLPNPLTLDYVLSLPLTEHPQLSSQQALLDKLQAQRVSQDAEDNVKLDLVGRLAWREYAEKDEDYHLAALHVQKSLYDFDRNQNLVDALGAKQQAQTILYADAEQRMKLEIMQSFFNVLLADFQYRIDNEAMAVAYVGLDKAKDRLELERISDVEYLQMESEYERIMVKRTRSEYNQLQTRLTLANLLDLPKARPDELSFPKLESYSQREAKDLKLEVLQQRVLDNNSQLTALKQRMQGAQLALQSQQAGNKPNLSLDAWAGKLSSYPEIREGNWQVGLTLDIPLYDGGLTAAKVSEAKAELEELKAQTRLLQQALRDEVAELYFQIKMLQAEKQQNLVFGDYADLYLDYSRALYENETATDIGDSMVRLSEANYNQVAWQFKQAMLWAKLDYLTGESRLTSSPSEAVSEDTQPAVSKPKQGNPS
ncbi:MAG: TolC family protein [Thiomicrorhabdus chilensis]|uniref:TolC family protein n=1 Tax=Thiomicrorhabdus chilensis TaxID=63656 RepID=UPI00299E8A2E|nr:TolC family protein [Thiomicrorhabdus chilensis]MDX1347007.1 TolC family protein [Thiomicrorhabdus chilensis]